MNNNRRMLWWIGGLLLLGIVLTGTVYGAVVPGMEQEREAKLLRQQDPLTHDIREVLDYRHPYMGNASNLGNLFEALPLNQLHRTLQLYPDALTAELRYTDSAHAVEPLLLKQALIYNATAAFALIDNLQTVKFHFKEEIFSISREQTEAWFDVPAASLIEPKTWVEQVQLKLKDADYVERCAAALIQHEKSL